MRTIGVLGGMTWHSSIGYYRLINELANERLGGTHAARCALVSVDMGLMEELMASGRWDEAGTLLAADAAAVERAGADVFILGCNSMHHVWDAIVEPLTIPTIHIGDATGDALAGYSRALLLGTRFTMEFPWLRSKIEERGVTVVIPDEDDRIELNRTVFEEFSHGVFSDATREYYVELISRFDVDAVVLACTEIGLLLRPGDVAVPMVDTMAAHARAVVDYAYDV
jgi:aspartate racemase